MAVEFDMGGGGRSSTFGTAPVDDANRGPSMYERRQVTVDGGDLGQRVFQLPEDQEQYEAFVESIERTGAEAQSRTTSIDEEAEAEADNFGDILAGLNITPGVVNVSVETILENNGIDPTHPALQPLIDDLNTRLNDPDSAGPAQSDLSQALMGLSQNPEYALPAKTTYDDAVAKAGFAGPPAGSKIKAAPGTPPGSLGGIGEAIGNAVAGVAGTIAAVDGSTKFDQSESGWYRHQNGTLVDPGGTVYFDPTSRAPGSFAWQRDVASNWSAEKVIEWKKRLQEYGYMPEGKADGKISPSFLTALEGYHISRYRYGKPMAAEGSDAAGSQAVKPVNLREIDSEIRNNVREEYRRIYGTEPSDGEVQTWASYIIKTGMDLQRKFISKYDNPNTASAVSEATESFIEKMETSPEARFLRESDEENTRLRETFDRMAQVTNSLAT